MRRERSVRGKVVALSGASRGIGYATAEALVAAGARVAIGARDYEGTRDAAKRLGGTTIGLPLDVTDRQSYSQFLDQVEATLGPLDVLVNNAGAMSLGSFVDEPDDVAIAQIDTNVHGTINGMKAALPRMQERGAGHIVNMSSALGKTGAPGVATYSGSKHAVIGISEAVRREVRKSGIDVSVVLPTLVRTELTSGVADLRLLPWHDADDVASAIVSVIRRPRDEVYVPGWVEFVARAWQLTPRRARDRFMQLLRAYKVLETTKMGERVGYEAKLTENPAADPLERELAAAAGPGEEEERPS
jgi:short-subunit dehydrogenase